MFTDGHMNAVIYVAKCVGHKKAFFRENGKNWELLRVLLEKAGFLFFRENFRFLRIPLEKGRKNENFFASS